MKNKKNVGYIRIINENNNICDLEIKYVVSKCLTGSVNSLICSTNDKGSGKTNFIYGSKYCDNLVSNNEKFNDENRRCLVEKLVSNLFIESNKIKCRFIRRNIIFLSKFRCSFLMIKADKEESNDLETVYDAFQGLYNPINCNISEDYNYFEFLQVDIQEPIQLLNLITIARKLQFERNFVESTKFHSLLIINIESILLNKELDKLKTLNKVSSQIFIIDFILTDEEIIKLHHNELDEKRISKELLIKFLKNLISLRSKNSLLLFSILTNGIINETFITIIFSRFNNINIILNKSEFFFDDFIIINKPKLNNFTLQVFDNHSLSSLVEKLHSYTLLLNKIHLEFGIEYIINSLKNGNTEFTNIFEEFASIIYNLSGNIFDFYEIASFINNLHILLDSVKPEQYYKKENIAINFTEISYHINSWFKGTNTNYKENDKVHDPLSKSEYYSVERSSQAVKHVEQCEKDIDSVNSINLKPNNFEDRIEESLTKRKDGLDNILLGEVKGHCQSTQNLNRSKSCINISMNYNLPTKVSVSAFSKILIAVNTARRRVREYRKKQQNQNIRNIYLNDDEQKENFFWKTSYKSPSISAESIFLKESTLPVDPITEIESCNESKLLKKETKDVEVQADITIPNPSERNELVTVRCIQIDKNSDKNVVTSYNCADVSNNENKNNIPNMEHPKNIIEQTKTRNMSTENSSTKNPKSGISDHSSKSQLL
ncbi:hypothetical protein FG386_000006 [Cryptosporidium ryanae]|uniref:uncharacterized protein n=1 Tax=Cryptosporidium ryanae TaxID=515981 RepID=UPI00351A37DF|nr:hypothetical protein FG386_000006 [Cryptosporidium ryanae]